MPEYAVDILPGEILDWIEKDAGQAERRLLVSASQDYSAQDTTEGESETLAEDDLVHVGASGLLELRPASGAHDWTLQLRAEHDLGAAYSRDADDSEESEDLTVEAFIARFLEPEGGEASAWVVAENDNAWQDFQRWLARQRG